MARRVFYSFHYSSDAWRTSQVRGIGFIEGNKSAIPNEWESIKNGGDKAIQKWIDDQLNGRSCTIVLIGKDTAGRRWIEYEIQKSWHDSKGLVGIHIHNLKDANQKQTAKGRNPFEAFTMKHDGTKLSSIVQTYDPPYTDSKRVYDYISQNISSWIEQAIKIRAAY
jgi:hypothetical protein